MSTVSAEDAYRIKRSLNRGLVVSFVMAMSLVVLLGRAFYIQAFDQPSFRNSNNDQGARTVRNIDTPAQRGNILDRNGQVLASSTPYFNVWVKRNAFDKKDPQLHSLATALETTSPDILARINGAKTDTVYLAQQLSDSQAALIRELKMAGLTVNQSSRRVYALGEAAAPLLGYVIGEGEAKNGIELIANQTLSGESGLRRVQFDGRSRPMAELSGGRVATAGNDLTLTIDKKIQQVMFDELKAAVLAHQAKAGSAIMVDVKTGDVLGIVSYPSFDPSPEASKDLANMALQSLLSPFEPGSTVKPFTIALALNNGVVKPETQFNIGGIERDFKSMKVRDSHAMGSADVSAILRHSSNIGTTLVARSLSAEQLYFWLNSLGFGQPLNVGIPKTSSGQLRPAKQWGDTGKITAGYGYGYSATLAHLARAYTALGNDGQLASLRLMQISPIKPAQAVMNPQTAQQILAMLEGSTQDGTGVKAQLEHYRVGGKTGTAKKLVEVKSANGKIKRRYSDSKYITSFVGLAPISKPKFALAIMVDEPAGLKPSGGKVAAPIFSNIAGQALRILAVAPDAPGKAIVNTPITEEDD